MPYQVTDQCILCGACMAGCPTGAVTIADGDTRSRIDPEVCIECGTCEENCPVEAIIYVDEE